MTELLSAAVEVRCDAAGALLAVRLPPGGWRAVERTLCRWMVETDWWGQAVHRDYRRCLLGARLGNAHDRCIHPDLPISASASARLGHGSTDPLPAVLVHLLDLGGPAGASAAAYPDGLLAGGDCVELAGDLVTGAWRVARRYD